MSWLLVRLLYICNQLQIYEGMVDPRVMSDNCTDNVPVLIKRATFCSAFAADARDFRSYNSWVRRFYPYPLFGYQSLLTLQLMILSI